MCKGRCSYELAVVLLNDYDMIDRSVYSPEERLGNLADHTVDLTC